jgi:hypothetical protein
VDKAPLGNEFWTNKSSRKTCEAWTTYFRDNISESHDIDARKEEKEAPVRKIYIPRP